MAGKALGSTLCLLAMTLPWALSAQPAEPAGAGDGPTPGIAIATAIPGTTAAQAILVGPSGELYHPAGANVWRRSVAGGVAGDVRAAFTPGAGDIMLASDNAPLYRLVNDVWQAYRLAERGRLHMATVGGHPVLSIGRHVYTWRGSRWKRVAVTRGRPTAVWASTGDRVYVALDTGALDRWHKGSWQRIRHPLPAGDTLVQLVGASGEKLYGIASSGAILDIGASQARQVELDADLAGFTPDVGFVAADGTLWLAGVQENGAATRAVLARRTRSALELVEVLDGVTPGDRVAALLADDRGGFLVATHRGVVLTRTGAEPWTRATLEVKLASAHPSGRSRAPAHTR